MADGIIVDTGSVQTRRPCLEASTALFGPPPVAGVEKSGGERAPERGHKLVSTPERESRCYFAGSPMPLRLPRGNGPSAGNELRPSKSGFISADGGNGTIH